MGQIDPLKMYRVKNSVLAFELKLDINFNKFQSFLDII